MSRAMQIPEGGVLTRGEANNDPGCRTDYLDLISITKVSKSVTLLSPGQQNRELLYKLKLAPIENILEQ